MKRGLFATLVSSTVLVACGGDAAPTQVLVEVVAEPGVLSQAERISIRVFGGPGGASPTERTVLDRELPRAGEALPASYTFTLAPEDGDARRVYRVRVEAFRAGEEAPFVRVQAASGYVEGESLRLVLTLTGDCVDVMCPEEQTCSSALCRNPQIDPVDLPRLGVDASMMMGDAGRDASTPVDAPVDAGLDAAPPFDAGSTDDAGSDASTSDAGGDAGPIDPGPLTIDRVEPAIGPNDRPFDVTIHGTGFTPATTVVFGTTAATVTDVTATTLVVTVPASFAETGFVDVTVTRDPTFVRLPNGYRRVDGTPDFAASERVLHTMPGSIAVVALETGDFVGDSNVDVAITALNPHHMTGIYEGDGAGGFTPAFVTTTSGYGGQDIKAVDADGDGDLDLVTAFGGWLRLYRNNGDGTFDTDECASSSTDCALAAGGLKSITVFDFDGMHALDLAARAAFTPVVEIWRSRGDGHYDRVQILPAPVGSYPDNSADGVAADFDRDGDVDLAMPGRRSLDPPVGARIDIFLNRGDGTGFDDATSVVIGGENTLGLALTHIDRSADDFIDILAGGFNFSTRDVHAIASNGDGTFGTPTPIGLIAAGNPFDVDTADLNYDGLDDVAMRWGNYNVSCYFSRPDGTLGAPFSASESDEVVEEISPVDYDGDGLLDILAIGRTGAGELILHVYRNLAGD